MSDEREGTSGTGSPDDGGGRTDALDAYSASPTPLRGYATLLAAWSVTFGSLLAAAAATDRLPSRIDPADVILLGVATHKVTRILTKDWVTAPLRAPFVRYEGSAGSGEVREKARGRGLRRAVGDLVTCPFCTGPWVAGAFLAGLIARPRVTRTVAAAFSAVAVSDLLHQAYGAARKAGA